MQSQGIEGLTVNVSIRVWYAEEIKVNTVALRRWCTLEVRLPARIVVLFACWAHGTQHEVHLSRHNDCAVIDQSGRVLSGSDQLLTSVCLVHPSPCTQTPSLLKPGR